MTQEHSSTWLVTGGAGFLGLHVLRCLLRNQQRVVSYDIQPIPPEERMEGVTEVTGDIRDTARLESALAGVDYVVHSAAALALAPPDEINAVNAEGTRLVLEASRRMGVKRVVYVSTTAVYGMPEYHPIYEHAPRNPMGAYGIAKAKAEDYCLASTNPEVVVIRPKSFIGTGRLGIFQILFDWIECGKKIYILGNGANRFQLLSVDDLAEAIRLAATRGKAGEVYNIGARNFGTVNDDVGALLDFAGTGSRMCHIPSRPAKAVLKILETLKLSPIYRWVYDTADQDSYVSIAKAEQELGWTARLSNRDALIQTYDWYLQEGKVLAKNTGTSHRVAWKQGILNVVKALS